jgi:DNA invertase Pin-like site-specific DNA recombinase
LKGLKSLLYDIEKKIINKVWLWEHSRSSRNKFLSFYQNDIFKKYNVIIYEKGKEIDLNIPETEFLQDILTGYSILERNKIVERVTRGFTIL